MATTIITLKHSQGFTLTEIMIALLLSLVLMAGVLTIMSSSKRTYALQTKLAELQDNARFVMNDLKSDLRMAGYGGCAGGYDPFFNGNINDQTVRDSNGNSIDSSYPLSDKMILNFSESLQYSIPPLLVPGMGIPSITLLSSPGMGFTVSNCGGPSPFNVTSSAVGPPVINLTPPLELPIDVLVSIRMYYEVCYINGEFALFRGVDANNTNTLCDDTEGEKTVGKELVVEGVENMQVRYGIDTSGDNIANQYSSLTPPLSLVSSPQLCVNNTGIPTAAVVNRSVVVSVRITLLMRTVGKRSDLDEATNKAFQLDDPSKKYKPNRDNSLNESGYRHRLFTSTIQIRNCFR